MIHPDTELKYISKEKQIGVIATRPIPAGSITWIQDPLDREISASEFDSLEPVYRKLLDIYAFRNNRGDHVLCWDNEKYINHSFKSNCLSTAYNFEIAIRDIQIGEELTDDYGYLNITYPFKGIDEGTKRKTVYPDDLLRYYKIWDKKIQKVFKKIVDIEQPLRPFVKDKLWKKINRIIAGEEELESILTIYYDNQKEEEK